MFIGVREDDLVTEISKYPIGKEEGILQIELPFTLDQIREQLEALPQTRYSVVYYRGGQFILIDRDLTEEDEHFETVHEALDRLKLDLKSTTSRALKDRIDDLTLLIVHIAQPRGGDIE